MNTPSVCRHLGSYVLQSSEEVNKGYRDGRSIIIIFMTAEEALFLYQLLTTNGITTWIIGGWGIDALFGEMSRTHKDLDILVLVDDVARLQSLLEQEGLHFAYLWEENRFVQDRQGNATATAFVGQDDAGREIDAHALWLDDQGNGVPAWGVKEGFLFPREDLAEQGGIAGERVNCISPKMQLVCHTGYDLPETHLRDVERIRAKIGKL